MSDERCFHDLRERGIVRNLAGVTACLFPGVRAMLSVVTFEPDAVSPIYTDRRVDPHPGGVEDRVCILASSTSIPGDRRDPVLLVRRSRPPGTSFASGVDGRVVPGAAGAGVAAPI